MPVEYAAADKIATDSLFDGLDYEEDDVPTATTTKAKHKTLTMTDIQRYITLSRAEVLFGNTPLEPTSPVA